MRINTTHHARKLAFNLARCKARSSQNQAVRYARNARFKALRKDVASAIAPKLAALRSWGDYISIAGGR